MVKHPDNPFVVHAAELLNCPRFVRNNSIDSIIMRADINEFAREYLGLVNRRYRGYHLRDFVLHLHGISLGEMKPNLMYVTIRSCIK